MKLPLLLVLALLGCEKTSNVGKMTEEAQGIVKNWAPRYEHLGKRAERLAHRGEALGATGQTPEAGAPNQLLKETEDRIGQMRQKIAAAPDLITAAAAASQKAGNTDPLNKLMNDIRTELGETHVELNANLNAVDSWIAYAEIGVRPGASTTPGGSDTPAPPPPETAPATDPLPPETPAAAPTAPPPAPKKP